jgi:hypothetical protein
MKEIEMDIIYVEPDGSLLMTCETCKKIFEEEEKDCNNCKKIWCG